MNLVRDYSGIIIDQNQRPVELLDLDTWVFQDFYLPDNLVRGTDANETRAPALSGLQVLLSVEDADSLEVEWFLDVSDSGWIRLVSGTTVGAHADGNYVWVDLLFDNPVIVPPDYLEQKLRLGIRGADVWVTAPNPVPGGEASTSHGPLFTSDEVPDSVALNFRLLGLVADEGVDFLGNEYRSVVVSNTGDSVEPGYEEPNSYWLSKPNPSRFAVESRYFDMGEPTVIDHIMLDPITPGLFFHVYYSDEEGPANNDLEWDLKMWTRIPRTYSLTKRENYALPEPIVARFIKIEFSHLQAKPYMPGDFEKPILYKKFPKWVLDFYLAHSSVQTSDLTTNRVGVVFDALDLAYNYYLDDIRQEADGPVPLDASQVVKNFLSDRNDYSDQVSPETLEKINVALDIFRNRPTALAKTDNMLGQQVVSYDGLFDYPTEEFDFSYFDPSELATLRREGVVYDESMPVMSFYLTCRHRYREISGRFVGGKAYYAGIREVAFTREHYTVRYDTPVYIEPPIGSLNIERNEFTRESDLLIV